MSGDLDKILPIIRIPLPAASGALGVSWAGPTGVVIGSFMVCRERGGAKKQLGVQRTKTRSGWRGRRVVKVNPAGSTVSATPICKSCDSIASESWVCRTRTRRWRRVALDHHHAVFVVWPPFCAACPTYSKAWWPLRE